MAIVVTHTKVSTIPDGDDSSVVRPSDWNADHQLVGTVSVDNGGTGASTLTGYVKGNGTSAFTASATVPSTDVTGLGTMSIQNSNNINVTGGSISGVTVSGYIPTSEKAQPLGVATLDAGGKVPQSQIPLMGDLNYQGTWNASTNTPTLVSSVGTKGYYYVVDVAGSTNLNGITDWQIGDWAIFNGTVWQKVDNTDSVTSVNGYTGTVVLNAADVGAVPYTGATGAVDLNAKSLTNVSNLGINTTSVPTIKLRAIGDNNSSSRIAMRGYSSDANSSSMRVTKFRGTFAAPQAPQSGDSLGKFELAGYGTTSSDGYPQASYEGLATEAWGATARGTKVVFKVTPNTTTTQVTALTINQDSTAVFANTVTANGVLLTGNTGTVTSVAQTVPSFLNVTGSPITSSGTLAIGYSGTALPLANGGTGATSSVGAMANLIGFTSTVTSATPVTLTNASTYYQLFTGSTAQTVTLPVTSTLQQGWSFHIVNNSTTALTLNSSGGNLVLSIIAGTTVMVTCILTTGTTAASWEAGYTDFSTATGTGNVVLASSPTISGAMNFTGSTTGNSVFGTSVTSGTLIFGGTAGTGAITFGQSTVSQTTNIQAGATASGSTKTMNIGTGGLTGSTTAITIGSTAGTSTTTVNGTLKAGSGVTGGIAGGTF